MSFATLDGLPILEATITLPRVGVWSASVVVDTASLPESSRASLTAPGLDLSGIVTRSGEYEGSLRLDIQGAGGLVDVISAKSFRDAPLRTMLSDALGPVPVVGDAGFLAQQVRSWVRVRGAARAEVASLARAMKAGWRVLPDGSVWFGAETWPVMEPEHELLEQSPERERIVVWSESLSLRPGVTFYGMKVSTVEHAITAERIRTTVWFER